MVKVAGYTHVGKRSNNEDNFLIAENFAAVADGMGGHNKGEVASSMAMECIRDQLEPLANISEDDVVNAVEFANLSIFNKAQDNDLMQNMGTTIVVCTWTDNNVIVGNVGDSRCYLISGNDVKQITTDHSYVQSLIDSGEITEIEAEKRHDKNIILRAAGCEATVETDIFKFSVNDGDIIILCSDGLNSALSAGDISRIAKECSNADGAAKELVYKAYENGSTDNITAVVIMFV